MDTLPLIYLAGPYTHEDPNVMAWRFRQLTRATAELSARGLAIFSPITHSHEVAKVKQLPTEWSFWERIDSAFVRKCDEFWVLQLEGWDRSVGVKAETELAHSLGMPVRYVQPKSFTEALQGYSERLRQMEPCHYDN